MLVQFVTLVFLAFLIYFIRRMALGSIVAARFLSLIAHFVITVTIFWSRQPNVLACLPLEYSQSDYDTKDTEMIVGLSLTLAFLAVELVGFISGVSMFNSVAGMLSIVSHSSAAISLSMFVLESWDCSSFWYIFGFCSAFPVFVEICVMVAVLCLRADK